MGKATTFAVTATLLLASLPAACAQPGLADAANNPTCVVAGKTGTICPDKSGAFDDCCKPLCSYNGQCPGLDGFCCPNPSGLMLGCCSESSAKAVPAGGSQNCEEENTLLAKWTFLRYGVLGLIMLWRVLALFAKAKIAGSEGSEHPELTKKMLKVERLEVSVALAGFIFVLTEGVGLAIYFAVSAMMDNIAIFLFSGKGFCKTVSAISLYTMALVTFLPNVFVGIRLQGKLYNRKPIKSKVLFIIFMVFITAASFGVRMWLVYNIGWAGFVDSLLQDAPSWFKLMLSVLVPPLVDGIQSYALILTGVKAEPPDQVPDQVSEQVPEPPATEPDRTPDPPHSDPLLPKPTYYVGQIVKVNNFDGTWSQARVTAKNPDGSIDAWLRRSNMQKSALLGETVVMPWPDGVSIYYKDEQVLVYSARVHKFVPATVKAVRHGGSCDVEWVFHTTVGQFEHQLERRRNIPLKDQDKEMKPIWGIGNRAIQRGDTAPSPGQRDEAKRVRL